MTIQAVSIILGEPDPALFALPTDYTGTKATPSPSELS